MILSPARFSLIALTCLLGGLSGIARLDANELVPSEGVVVDEERQAELWKERIVDGVSYVSWAQFCAQYDFSHVALSDQPLTYRHHEFDLRIAEDAKSVFLQGFKIELMHPILFLQGMPELISKADCVQLLDPILRATYVEPARPVEMVLINAPYGGMNQGDLMQPDSKIREARYTLELAKKLKSQLNAKGVHCELVRKGDQFLSDQSRISHANSYSNAIYISLHVNDGHPSRAGVECYTYRPNSPHSALLGMSMLSHLVKETGAQDGGLRGSYYSALRSIHHPACLLYLGYSSHPIEGAKLLDEDYKEEMVNALEKGVLNYIRLSQLPRTVDLDRERRAQEVIVPEVIAPEEVLAEVEESSESESVEPEYEEIIAELD